MRFELCLNEGESRREPLAKLTDVLATVRWETAKTMQPVRADEDQAGGASGVNLTFAPPEAPGDHLLVVLMILTFANEAVGTGCVC